MTQKTTSKMKNKYVYIFGNKYIGFHGHTYDKQYAKAIKKYRKGFTCFKIKNNKYCEENLSVNTEFLQLYDDVYMTADEEEFYIESFTQFQRDVVRNIINIMKYYKYMKWNDEEKYYIKYLFKLLLDYRSYLEHGQYEDDADDSTVFDNEKAMKYFIKKVLDGDNT